MRGKKILSMVTDGTNKTKKLFQPNRATDNAVQFTERVSTHFIGYDWFPQNTSKLHVYSKILFALNK